MNSALSVFGLSMMAFFTVIALRNVSRAQSQAQEIFPRTYTETGNILRDGSVLGQTDASLPGALQSESYALGKIAVGGDIWMEASDIPESGTLEVSAVRGESFMDKGKKDVNILVTWKTTKLSMATIKYGKSGTDFSQTIAEDGYGFNHSMILPALDQASTYVYVVIAKDRAGNEVTTDSYAVYTGTKNTSLFDLISGAVTDIFGWAIKK